MSTLRETLAALRDMRSAIELQPEASGTYGEEGERIAPALLLDRLAASDPGELARPAMLVWDSRHRGYIYPAGEPLGWIHVGAPRELALSSAAPALWIMDREEEGASDPGA